MISALFLFLSLPAHADERTFTQWDSVQGIPEFRCNEHDYRVRQTMQNAENRATNEAVGYGYPYCTKLNPNFFPKKDGCLFSVNLSCSKQQPGGPVYPGPCQPIGEPRVFTWYDSANNIDEWRCNLNDWQVRQAVDRARGVAENRAFQDGYKSCTPMNPTYYYRGGHRECVVTVPLSCRKMPENCR